MGTNFSKIVRMENVKTRVYHGQLELIKQPWGLALLKQPTKIGASKSVQ